MRERFLQPVDAWMCDWVAGLAGRFGDPHCVTRIGAAVFEEIDDLLVGQWLLRCLLKAVELGESLAEDFVSQRFVSAQAMTRALLETAGTLAWVSDECSREAQLVRIRRALKTSYANRVKKGAVLPEREQACLDAAVADGLKNLPDFRGILGQLDAAEARRDGGNPHWVSHYRQFGISSDFLHDPFIGVSVFAIDAENGLMHIDLNPDVRVGLVALRWGGFYLVRCLDTVIGFAGIGDESAALANAYAIFKRTSESRLAALTR